MHRIARRPARLMALAAVPALLIAGCSSDSDNGSATAKDTKAPAKASASPTLAAAKYRTLPDPCKALSKDTVKDLVPKAENASGEAADSSDTSSRGSCSWNGLDGYQYRWLDVAFQRFESLEGVGDAEDLAKKRFTAHLEESAKNAKDAARKDVEGIGDQTTRLSWKAKEDGEEYRNVVLVTRTSNVVVITHYNGAGFEDAKTPAAEDIEKGAEKAAKEAVTAVK